MRGFMEGHPPSMLCYCISTMPFILALNKSLIGINIRHERILKSRSFADDTKIFLTYPREIYKAVNVIEKFEFVSGVSMHRNKAKKKCNILTFGDHSKFQNWPDYFNVTNKMKVIGAWFSNEERPEKINSREVKMKVVGKLSEYWGMKSTLFEKVYFINTFCFSKLYYISQAIKIDQKTLDEIRKLALQFLFVGENERPVQTVNFRNRDSNGLGLVMPDLKVKSLLFKNMYRECIRRGVKMNGDQLSINIYGNCEEFRNLFKSGNNFYSKALYKELLFKFTHRGTSLIPSRLEKKTVNISWQKCHKNAILVRTALDNRGKEFTFKLLQDLLPVKGRIHRANADKRCLREKDGMTCTIIQDRTHFFSECSIIKADFNKFVTLMSKISCKKLSSKQIMHLSISLKCKRRLKLVLFIIIRYLYMMFHENLTDCKEMMKRIVKELEFYEKYRFEMTLFNDYGSIKELITNL